MHLGSDVCQAKALQHFLKDIHKKSNRLILNGDVFDSMDFRRLKKQHWKILSILRKISDKIEVVWIVGNHDGDAETISHLLGLTVVDEYEFTSGTKKIITLHGHKFDEFLTDHPILVTIGDWIYTILQRIDSYINKKHHIARFAKHNSKQYLRCAEIIKNEAIKLAKKNDCQTVCCGHTHHESEVIEDGVQYLNCGCWTELPCHYVTITDGEAKLNEYTMIEHDELQSIQELRQT